MSLDETSMQGNHECVWASLHFIGSRRLYVGAFYRAPGGDISGLDVLHDNLADMYGGSTIPNIVIGDFNCGDVNWTTGTLARRATVAARQLLHDSCCTTAAAHGQHSWALPISNGDHKTHISTYIEPRTNIDNQPCPGLCRPARNQ